MANLWGYFWSLRSKGRYKAESYSVIIVYALENQIKKNVVFKWIKKALFIITFSSTPDIKYMLPVS